jgi:hypothetical protein
MALDRHRYGALIVLDRWSTLTGAFGPHLELPRHTGIIEHAGARIRDAQEILVRANEVIDTAGTYTTEVVEASLLAWQALHLTFAEERRETEEAAKLGPMLPQDYLDARRVFLEDLAAR